VTAVLPPLSEARSPADENPKGVTIYQFPAPQKVTEVGLCSDVCVRRQGGSDAPIAAIWIEQDNTLANRVMHLLLAGADPHRVGNYQRL
jgi:hypothetical protein